MHLHLLPHSLHAVDTDSCDEERTQPAVHCINSLSANVENMVGSE